MVICYLQESSLVILSWKGNDVLHRGLVMLGNKLHIFISFPYCVVLSTHTRTKDMLTKHTYGGDAIFSIHSHSLQCHMEIAVKPTYGFLKKLPWVHLYFHIFIPAFTVNRFTPFLKCHSHTQTYLAVLYLMLVVCPIYFNFTIFRVLFTSSHHMHMYTACGVQFNGAMHRYTSHHLNISTIYAYTLAWYH